jgi:hypothetical protein
MSYFFNAPVQIPNGANLAIANSSGNKLFFNSNGTMSSSYELVFPSADGTNGQALITDGSGNLRFGTVSGGGAVSELASNAIINSTSGDIVFTTDDGDATLSSLSGNVIINSNGDNDFIHLVGNNQILISTNGNIAKSNFDTSNVTVALLDNIIGIQKRCAFSNQIECADVTESSSLGTGALIVSGGVGIEKNLNVGGNVNVADTVTLQSTLDVTGTTNLNDITESSSTSTGALIVDGGVGIAKNLNVGGNVDVTGNVNVTKSVDITQDLVVDGTSTLTGDVTASANVDVTGNVNVYKSVDITQDLVVDGITTLGTINAGSLTLSGDLTVNGTTTTINSNVTTVDDPVIQLGLAGVADTFDRGIRGEYNDGSDKSLFFGWDRSENHFTFIPDATYSSSNIATGTVGDAKFFNMDLSGNLNIDSTEASTSTSTGALVVDGGVGVAGSVYVGENVVATSNVQGDILIAGSTGSTLIGTSAIGDLSLAVGDATGNVHILANQILVGQNLTNYGLWGNTANLSVGKALKATSTLDVTGATTLSGQTNVNNKLVVAVDEFTDKTGSADNLWNGSNAAVNKHILLDTTNISNYSSSGSYTTGQMMNIFYTNNSGGTASANIDFGANSLYSGSGLARYLVFSSTGQSASLIYMDSSGNNDGWRIINTGAEVH